MLVMDNGSELVLALSIVGLILCAGEGWLLILRR